MIVKYSDIKKEVLRSRRREYGLGVVFDLCAWLLGCAEIAKKRVSRIILTVLCFGVFVWLTINYLSTGKKLKKMWKNIGSPNIDTINQILGEAVSLNSESVTMLMTPEYILDFQELKAYRLTDITQLYKSSNSDDDGDITNYVLGVVCKNCSFERDELCFGDAILRDAAIAAITEAYYSAGGTEIINEEK